MYDYDRRKLAMEHATPGAKKKYLKEHPDADPKNHTVSKGKGSGGGGGASRKQETDKLLKEYGTKPGLERKVKELKEDAQALDRLEQDYSQLPADEHYSMQSKIEKAFDDYSKKLEHCTGFKPKKPWYYDR